MKQVFVKKGELKLVNGGYLAVGKKDKPVTNKAFIALQKRAEYIVTFAEMAKGKTFIAKKVDSVEDVKTAVLEKLETKNKITFVEAGKKVKTPTIDKLAKEALSFIEGKKDVSKVNQINEFLSEFELLSDFEENGLFFEEGVVKLDRIYTLEEVVNATKEVIDIIK